MGPMLATANESFGPTVENAIGNVSDVVGAAFGCITHTPILAAMFGLALIVPAFKIIKKAKSAAK